MSVYTKINQQEMTDFIGRFDVGELVEYRASEDGIQNTNYFVTTKQNTNTREFVLTIFEQLTTIELPYFVALQQHLASAGLPVADPVRIMNHQAIHFLKKKAAVLFPRLAGAHVTHPNLEQCTAIGAMVGRLHAAVSTFGERSRLPSMLDYIDDQAKKWANTLPREDQRLLLSEMAQLRTAFSTATIPTGTIHGDLFRDNVLFEDNTVTGIIDFYFASQDFLLLDLAIIINDWCVTNPTAPIQTNGGDGSDGKSTIVHSSIAYNGAAISAILSAYQHHRPVTKAEIQLWPSLLRLAALKFWVFRLAVQHGSFQHLQPDQVKPIKDPGDFKAVVQYLHNHTGNEFNWPDPAEN